MICEYHSYELQCNGDPKKMIKERGDIQNIPKLLIMSSFLPLSRNPVEHSSLHLEHMLYELFVYKSHSKTID